MKDKDVAPTILGTVEVNPLLLRAADVYCNFSVGYDNLFAEHDGTDTNVYIFNADNGLFQLDTAELLHVFRLRSLSAAVLRSLPLDYLVSALRHSRLVYQSYFKDDVRYGANISWAARATALNRGANAAEAKRYMWLADAAFGCLGYRAELGVHGLRVTPRAYEVQPASMNRHLAGLAKLDLLTFNRVEDDFLVRLKPQPLDGLDAEATPLFFVYFLR